MTTLLAARRVSVPAALTLERTFLRPLTDPRVILAGRSSRTATTCAARAPWPALSQSFRTFSGRANRLAGAAPGAEDDRALPRRSCGGTSWLPRRPSGGWRRTTAPRRAAIVLGTVELQRLFQALPGVEQRLGLPDRLGELLDAPEVELRKVHPLDHVQGTRRLGRRVDLPNGALGSAVRVEMETERPPRAARRARCRHLVKHACLVLLDLLRLAQPHAAADAWVDHQVEVLFLDAMDVYGQVGAHIGPRSVGWLGRRLCRDSLRAIGTPGASLLAARGQFVGAAGGAAVPGAGAGAAGAGVPGAGAAVPGAGAAVPGAGAGVPGTGAAVPGAGATVPGAGAAVPGAGAGAAGSSDPLTFGPASGGGVMSGSSFFGRMNLSAEVWAGGSSSPQPAIHTQPTSTIDDRRRAEARVPIMASPS